MMWKMIVNANCKRASKTGSKSITSSNHIPDGLTIVRPVSRGETFGFHYRAASYHGKYIRADRRLSQWMLCEGLHHEPVFVVADLGAPVGGIRRADGDLRQGRRG